MSNMKSSYYKFILIIILCFIGLWLLMFITSKDSTIQILLPWLETVKFSDRATLLSRYDSIETHQSETIQDNDRNKTASSRNDSDVEYYNNSTNGRYDSDYGKRYGHFNRIQSIIRNPLIYKNKTSPQFLPNYRSPCFLHPKTTKQIKSTSTLTGQGGFEVLCLPHFYVIGFPKCASSDIYSRLRRHKYIHGGKIKENRFMHSSCGTRSADVMSYINNYKSASQQAEKMVTNTDNGSKYHHMALGDFTPTNARRMPYYGSSGVMAAHCIHGISPHTKIIVTLRNPVTRTLSGHKFSRRNTSGWKYTNESFHSTVVADINWWNTCMETTKNVKFTCQLLLGKEVVNSIYYYPLREWLKVLPKENFLFIKFEDYTVDPQGYLDKYVLPFLNLSQITEDEIAKNRKPPKTPNSAGGMLYKTRTILEEFYRPLNKLLSELVQDDRFLWDY